MIATLIPVYMLVLYVGRERLIEDPLRRAQQIEPTRAFRRELARMHAVMRLTSTYSVVVLTAAEVLAVLGLVNDAGVSGWRGTFAVFAVVSAVVIFGSATLGPIWIERYVP
ncbi:hypothetical protein FA014_01980 [Cellulomonas hominis]|uniref:Uncharacterized protein n=1 Tax=Cellulomonas hominis TaxID=156981 RepID=A0A7Z8NRW9_9CELL|nr:hypothetical protein [Cellulomonas hominis]TKR27149.1 hypothetical protein FA014_01980 [Cellulomonas hominis]